MKVLQTYKKKRLWLTVALVGTATAMFLLFQSQIERTELKEEPVELATNPIIYADAPDPDIVRVGNTYYMVTTSMHMMPGSPIMSSTDLVNWDIIGYPYDRLEENNAYKLKGGLNAYGKGSWANSLRYHDGNFYVLTASLDTGKTYLFCAEDPKGKWTRTEFEGYMHDPSLLFDDDGKAYIIFGIENLTIKELTSDYKAINPSGLNKVILASGKEGMEGTHAYKINGKYYLTTIWWEKGQIRKQFVYRSDRIDGPYEGRLALSDTMGYKQSGVAQGGLVDTLDGKWYAMLFQDHDAVGRTLVLLPVKWQDGWPVYGDAEGKVPLQIVMPGIGTAKSTLTRSDEFYQERTAEVAAVSVETASPSNPHSDEELVRNGDFNVMVMNWTAKDGAQISVVGDPSDASNQVALIANRPATYAGIGQNMAGRLVPGERYKAKFLVNYTQGPETKEFVLTAKITAAGETNYVNLVKGIAKRSEWTEISGVFTIDGNLNNIQLFFETPWTDNPDPVNDRMDFFLDQVSIKASPLTDAEKGEAMPNGSVLGLQWQWNHNPNHTKWTLTERRGFLRLTTDGVVGDLLQARNTLTQRSQGPRSSGWIMVDTGSMLDGDFAGLAAFQEQYGFIGVTREGGKRYLVMAEKGGEKARAELKQEQVHLKVDFDFEADKAKFFYSLNGTDWTAFGSELQMRYTIPHFMGYRFALFNYATIQDGGYVDFDYFRFSDDETGVTTPAVLSAYLKEDAIKLRKEKGNTYNVRLLMDDFPKGAEVTQIHAKLRVPDAFEVEAIIPSPSNVLATRVAFQPAANDLELQIGNADGTAISFANRDASKELVTIKLKLKRELTERMKEELKVSSLEIVQADNQTKSYDVSGASAQLSFEPPASAIGKLPPNGNPVVSHMFGADPYALVFGDRVYLYNTNDVLEYDKDGNVKDNTYSSINKLSVISSADLMNWTDHGVINVSGPEGEAKWATQSWAPAAAHKVINGQDKFFLYFANNASGIGVLTSNSPIGPWTDPIGKPLISRSTPGVESVTWLFDPAVLVDNDGKAYIYFGGGIPEGKDEKPDTARVMQLGDDMISVIDKAVVIPAPFMFEDAGINKVGGTYYFTYCSNFYGGSRPEGSPPAGEIAYMTSDNPMGPWTYQGTILKNPGHFFGVGGNNHHAMFQFQDNWYMAYHAQTLSKEMGVPRGYRSTHLNQVNFNGDGSIQEIAADLQGVKQIKHVNPFARVEANTFAWSAGITVQSTTEASLRKPDIGMVIADIDNGDWTAVAGVDFGEGASSFAAAVSGADEGSIMELRLDRPDGKLIGTLVMPKTDDSDRWIELTTSVEGVEGIYDLYFVFKGKAGRKLMTFGHWQFSK